MSFCYGKVYSHKFVSKGTGPKLHTFRLWGLWLGKNLVFDPFRWLSFPVQVIKVVHHLVSWSGKMHDWDTQLLQRLASILLNKCKVWKVISLKPRRKLKNVTRQMCFESQNRHKNTISHHISLLVYTQLKKIGLLFSNIHLITKLVKTSYQILSFHFKENR